MSLATRRQGLIAAVGAGLSLASTALAGIWSAQPDVVPVSVGETTRPARTAHLGAHQPLRFDLGALEPGI